MLRIVSFVRFLRELRKPLHICFRDLLTFNFWMEIESHPFISHFNIVRALVNLICQSEMTQMYKILLTQFAVCDSTAARRSRSNGPFQSLL